jgi:glycerophosphoryl diester phosphodiesterase
MDGSLHAPRTAWRTDRHDGCVSTTARPIVSAHRHGNDPELVRAAVEAGADLVEVDVHLFLGRLEVRHAKRVGPLPLLFDRGEPWHVGAWPVRLEHVVDAVPDGTVLHIDLKGWSPRLARRVRRALGDDRAYVVSSRSWWLLRHFRGREGVRTMRSIGAPWQLRWFLVRHRRGVGDDICIRADRLDPELAATLRSRCERLLVWRVDSLVHVEQLTALGVHGVIVDDLTVVAAVVDARDVGEAPAATAADAVPRGDAAERGE